LLLCFRHAQKRRRALELSLSRICVCHGKPLRAVLEMGAARARALSCSALDGLDRGLLLADDMAAGTALIMLLLAQSVKL
jgi:hypothetical protein